MDPLAAKYIGAGLACIGMAGAGIGLGNLFGQFLQGALRNPSAADGQRGTLLLGDRKSTRLNSSHIQKSRMPSSA